MEAPGAWSRIRFANIAFGQGFLSTALELVRAYACLANGGHLVRPRIVEGEAVGPRERVLGEETAWALRRLLSQVVEKGTGHRAKIASHRVAGKTGTSQKARRRARGYSSWRRVAHFAGFAPAQDPHLVIYVALDEPRRRPYTGGRWAAPIFAHIAGASLDYLNVPPQGSGF